MNPSKRRLVTTILVLVVALWFVGVIVFIAVQSQHHPTHHSSPVRYTRVADALRARLRGRGLSYRWVVCTATPHRYAGRPLERCNVDFGDPHLVPYCAVLIGGRLLTDHENRRISCGSRLRDEEQDRSVNAR